MFSKQKRLEFKNLYNQNPETKAYMIEVSLEDYAELFNGWDASPLRRKDLEPELIDYLEQAGSEIPKKELMEICLYLPKDKTDSDKEQKSLTGIRNNFKVVKTFIDKNLHKNYRQVLTYIMMSLGLLVIAYLIRDTEDISFLMSVMIEGFFIGGWFLLWEAFSTFFFTAHETRIRKALYQRFLDSRIYFKEMKDGQTPSE